MADTETIIAENAAHIRERIAKAAAGAGRSPDEIEVVAVTKYVGTAEAAAVVNAGFDVLGESRPQQLWEKSPLVENARWHLIGHLQRNKVRRTLPLVDLIHSVDSPRLLQAIDTIGGELGICASVLLEVNCSGEAEKHGFTAEGLRRFLPELATFSHVEVRGLMTMAAREGGTSSAAENFSMLRELRETAQNEAPPEVQFTELSMGMSHDFEVAISMGATMVRIGSLFFEGVDR